MNSLILCKLPILFTTVKLNVGHKLSQFIHKLKIGIQVFPNSQGDFEIFRFSIFSDS